MKRTAIVHIDCCDVTESSGVHPLSTLSGGRTHLQRRAARGRDVAAPVEHRKLPAVAQGSTRFAQQVCRLCQMQQIENQRVRLRRGSHACAVRHKIPYLGTHVVQIEILRLPAHRGDHRRINIQRSHQAACGARNGQREGPIAATKFDDVWRFPTASPRLRRSRRSWPTGLPRACRFHVSSWGLHLTHELNHPSTNARCSLSARLSIRPRQRGNVCEPTPAMLFVIGNAPALTTRRYGAPVVTTALRQPRREPRGRSAGASIRGTGHQ